MELYGTTMRLYRKPGKTEQQKAATLKEQYSKCGNFVMVNTFAEKTLGLGPARVLA